MERRLAVAVMSAGIIAVIALTAFYVARTTGAHVEAWVVTRDLPAGATIDAESVHQASLPTGGDTVNLADAPVGALAAHALHVGDTVRPDDVLSSANVAVSVTFKSAPPLNPGDSIDIYVPASPAQSPTGTTPSLTGNASDGLTGQSVQLLARNVTVIAGGTTSVIQVPAEQEPLWVAVTMSGRPLTVVKSTGVRVPGAGHVYSSAQAIDQLAQIAAGAGQR